ncbi:GntR family transcriptional regulator [Robbsia sp. Bb-Pol-6]|uniref:GntR family transcriptional regulator n=1 Tax=Robbsia betulipollinis TaxID=2981849 RepID=A0ABT3ZJR6_9BURK|nr:GntR family transcriptional regulator [Robbsia betulipollinis]MCY0386761.1 GntR family transcriptional regulator [Robbsia betulipollinis]
MTSLADRTDTSSRPSPAPPPADGPRAEEAYVAIRADVLSCRLAPEAMVTEPELMRRYGLGKNSCRHALIRLVQEGFLAAIPRQGYRIAGITLKDVEEVFALRVALEPLAANLAVGKVDIALLRQYEAACRVPHPVLDLDSQIGVFLDANKAFHLTIAAASGNHRLYRILCGLFDEMSRLVAMGFGVQKQKPEIKHDHHALIDAFEAGDGKRAELIARRHIETFQAMTLEKVYESLSQARAPLAAFKRAGYRS